MCLGLPGQVVRISDAAGLRAQVEVEGVLREVSVAMLGVDEPDGARAGDWVLVHLGFVLAKIDEAEAREMLDARRALGEMYERELT